MTTTEAIKRTPQRDATGALAAPTPTDHRTSYPCGGASKDHGGRDAIFPTSSLGQATRRPTQRAKKTRYALNGSIASSPSLLCARRFGAPFAHPRDPEGDNFLSWTTKKEEAVGSAHATPQAVALVYPRRCSSAGRCVTCCVFPISHMFELGTLSSISIETFFFAKSKAIWKMFFHFFFFL